MCIGLVAQRAAGNRSGGYYTLKAMIVAQTIIALPLTIGLTMTSVESVNPNLKLQVIALGATRWQSARAVLREARVGVTAAIVAAFGGIISEVGAVMLVGGNIAGANAHVDHIHCAQYASG